MKVLEQKNARRVKTGIDGPVAQTFLIIYLSLMTLLALTPVLVTLMLSLKPNADFLTKNIWALPTKWQFSNYKSAFSSVWQNMFNTLVIDLVSTVGVALLSSYVAYVFVRKTFAGKNVLFFLVILPMLVPSVVSLTPQYLNIVKLNLIGSWWGLIIPYLAGNQIASIFLYRVFMGQQPADLYEAAAIDGAGMIRSYLSICLPLSVSIIMVQSVAIFAAIYNDYLWPLMIFVGNSTKSTLMPVLTELAARVSQNEKGASYALYMVSGIPLIFSTIASVKFVIGGDFAAGLKL
jgi:ABC-type glycerol-3-phosphate transport system permease component